MDHTPEISAILDSLANVCCSELERSEAFDAGNVHALVESLSANGWERHSEGQQPLSVHLEQRVKQRCRATALHRGAEIDAMVRRISNYYSEISRETSKPLE